LDTAIQMLSASLPPLVESIACTIAHVADPEISPISPP
jgi:hypothetical protein